MSAARQLYQLDARCDKCGAPLRLRATHHQVRKWASEDPSELVHTYQCSFETGRGRKCNAIVPVTAGDYQRAKSIG